MHASASGQVWTGGHQAVVETIALGTPGSPIAAIIGPARTSVAGESGGLRILARLPDVGPLDAIPASPTEIAPSHVRIISQGLAAKLLLGGTILLMAAAVLPSLFGGKATPAPGQGNTPAWQPVESVPPAGPSLTVSLSGAETARAPAEVAKAADAPVANVAAASALVDGAKNPRDAATSTDSQPAPPAPPAPPTLQPAAVSPPPAGVDQAASPLGTMHLSPPSGSQEKTIPNQPLLLTPHNVAAPNNVPTPSNAPVPDNAPAPNNGHEESAWPRASSTSLVEQRPQPATNLPVTIAGPRPSFTPDQQSDYPRNVLRDDRGPQSGETMPDIGRFAPPDYRGTPRADGSSDLRSERPAGAGGQNSASAVESPGAVPSSTVSEAPGVARFNGTNPQPSVRTRYDFARPGVY